MKNIVLRDADCVYESSKRERNNPTLRTEKLDKGTKKGIGIQPMPFCQACKNMKSGLIIGNGASVNKTGNAFPFAGEAVNKSYEEGSKSCCGVAVPQTHNTVIQHKTAEQRQTQSRRMPTPAR